MQNEHSSDGIAEDLIRSYVQMACSELHLKTLIEKENARLTNGLIDIYDGAAVKAQTEKITYLIEELEATAQVRRSVMLRLFDMYKGDKQYWCLAKHMGTAAFTLFEAYQASDSDQELLDLAISANNRFISVMSRFLGLEVKECAACFSDALKGEG